MSDKYLIFTRRGIKIEEYPAILAHLEQFKARLMPKPKGHSGDWGGRKEGTYLWYEIQDAVDYYPEFEQPKLIIPAIIKKPETILDPNGRFSNDKTTIVATDDMFVLAALNSRVVDFFMQNIASTKQNGYFEYKPVYISQIPIPHTDSTKKALVTTLVTRILSAKRASPQADTSALEAEVDALVYGLYGLTAEEIAVVEGR